VLLPMGRRCWTRRRYYGCGRLVAVEVRSMCGREEVIWRARTRAVKPGMGRSCGTWWEVGRVLTDCTAIQCAVEGEVCNTVRARCRDRAPFPWPGAADELVHLPRVAYVMQYSFISIIHPILVQCCSS
jgi:hypothetical protein